MDRARYQQEAQRLSAILRGEIQRQGVSIRSLEQKMGVGNSVYQKVLGGKISMTLGHLLQMIDALGLAWPDFFHMAYPLAASAPEALPSEEDDFEQRVMDVLRRHGLLPEPASGG